MRVVARWIFHGDRRWVPVAAGAAAPGALALLPWWLAVGTNAPWTSVVVNALLLTWSALVLVALLVPALREQTIRLAGGG